MPVNFDPPTITLMMKILKIVGMLILIAQKKCPDALNTTQRKRPKVSAMYRSSIKLEKTFKKWHF